MRTRSFRLQIASATAMALTVCSSAHADEPADFYQGKSVRLYLGYPPSGAYDFVCQGGQARLDSWDPEFRAEADRLALEIDPLSGETLQAMVARMFGAPREVVEAARRAIGQR